MREKKKREESRTRGIGSSWHDGSRERDDDQNLKTKTHGRRNENQFIQTREEEETTTTTTTTTIKKEEGGGNVLVTSPRKNSMRST